MIIYQNIVHTIMKQCKHYIISFNMLSELLSENNIQQSNMMIKILKLQYFLANKILSSYSLLCIWNMYPDIHWIFIFIEIDIIQDIRYQHFWR